jgi:hypothetical protein
VVRWTSACRLNGCEMKRIRQQPVLKNIVLVAMMGMDRN